HRSTATNTPITATGTSATHTSGEGGCTRPASGRASRRVACIALPRALLDDALQLRLHLREVAGAQPLRRRAHELAAARAHLVHQLLRVGLRIEVQIERIVLV